MTFITAQNNDFNIFIQKNDYNNENNMINTSEKLIETISDTSFLHDIYMTYNEEKYIKILDLYNKHYVNNIKMVMDMPLNIIKNVLDNINIFITNNMIELQNTSLSKHNYNNILFKFMNFIKLYNVMIKNIYKYDITEDLYHILITKLIQYNIFKIINESIILSIIDDYNNDNLNNIDNTILHLYKDMQITDKKIMVLFFNSFNIEEILFKRLHDNVYDVEHISNILINIVNIFSTKLNKDAKKYIKIDGILKSIISLYLDKQPSISGILTVSEKVSSLQLLNNFIVNITNYGFNIDQDHTYYKMIFSKILMLYKTDIIAISIWYNIFNLINTSSINDILIYYLNINLTKDNIQTLIQLLFTNTANNSIYIIVDIILNTKYNNVMLDEMILYCNKLQYNLHNIIDYENINNKLIKLAKISRNRIINDKSVLTKYVNLLQLLDVLKASYDINMDLKTIDINMNDNLLLAKKINYNVIVETMDNKAYNAKITSDLNKYILIFDTYTKIKIPQYNYNCDHDKSVLIVDYIINDKIYKLELNIILYTILSELDENKQLTIDELHSKIGYNDIIIKNNCIKLINEKLILFEDGKYIINTKYNSDKHINKII